MQPIIRRLFVSCWILILTAATASAHKPISIGGVFPTYDQALMMSEIDVSQVVYSPLSEANAQLWLVLQAEADTQLDVSLGVPVLERLTGYRPNLAVLAPGLPAIDLPFMLPANVGGIVLASAGTQVPRAFHEPFTGTNSWILIEDSIELPVAGLAYIVAWAPNDQADKLWVAIGQREQFGPADFVSFPAIIREVRAFHEAGPQDRGVLAALLFGGFTAAWLALLFAR